MQVLLYARTKLTHAKHNPFAEQPAMHMAAALGTLILCALLLFAQVQSQEEFVESEARGESEATGSRGDMSNSFIGGTPIQLKEAVCRDHTLVAIKDRLSRHDSAMFSDFARKILDKKENYVFKKPAESKLGNICIPMRCVYSYVHVVHEAELLYYC